MRLRHVGTAGFALLLAIGVVVIGASAASAAGPRPNLQAAAPHVCILVDAGGTLLTLCERPRARIRHVCCIDGTPTCPNLEGVPPDGGGPDRELEDGQADGDFRRISVRD